MTARRGWTAPAAWLVLGTIGVLVSGCGGATERDVRAATEGPNPIVVTVAPTVHQPVERTIDVGGTLHGWEEVTLGSKQTGRVLTIRHDVGDRVSPGEPLVDLDPIDARLAVDEARSRLLGELVRLGISAEQAEHFTSRYGVSEEILANEEVTQIISKTPSVEQARATLDQAELRLNRQRQLTQRGAGTVQEMQDTESEHRIARAALDNAILTARTVIANALSSHVALQQAETMLGEMNIEAPRPSALPPGVDSIDEIRYAISRRHVSEGQFIRPGDPVFDLVLEHPLRLRAKVAERFIADVAEGQGVALTVAAYPETVFDGRVSRINPAVDKENRTFEVEAEVPNAEVALHPGSFAKARIVTRREDDATLVPIEAVVQFAGVVKLFLFESDAAGGSRAREVRVETGPERDGLIEIVGGLPEGAVVITSGQTHLADGTSVVVREAIEPEVGTVTLPPTPGEGSVAPTSNGE